MEVVYTPSGGEDRPYLNGFEIDTPALNNQISFPYPAHRDERLQLEGSNVTASWRAPAAGDSPVYNVYLGTVPDDLQAVEEGLSETEVVLSGESPSVPVSPCLCADCPGLNKLDTFYWRIDVVSGETTYTGRVFTFRLAHLAFPGAEGWG